MAAEDKFCAGCGHPGGTPAQTATRRQSTVLLIAAAIVLLWIVIAVVSNTNSDNTTTAPAKFDPATLLPGATVQLRTDGGTSVPGVPTHELYKEWMKLGEAKDTLGVQMMSDRGQMLWTPNGTRARILESHDLWDASYNVRILDGPLYGQSVWTSKAFVKEDKPATSSQGSGSALSACPACPTPGTNVVVKFAGNSKTTEVIEAYVSEDAYRKFVSMMESANNVAALEGDMNMFRSGELVGISNGSRAEVVRSVRFTTDPQEQSPWWNGICIRILEGTCHEVSGERSAQVLSTVDKDCEGRVLWVNSVFISVHPGKGGQEEGSKADSSAAEKFNPPTAIAGPPALDLNRGDNGTGPWLVLKDPYRRRGEMLIMALTPVMMSRGESFRFNRMISEDTALFDYQGGIYQHYLTGQIAVIVDPSRGMDIGPVPYRDWKIEPMGTLAGTNGFRAPIQVPLIKFWGYCDAPMGHSPGTWPPCREDVQTNP